jgi:hypothetical protein
MSVFTACSWWRGCVDTLYLPRDNRSLNCVGRGAVSCWPIACTRWMVVTWHFLQLRCIWHKETTLLVFFAFLSTAPSYLLSWVRKKSHFVRPGAVSRFVLQFQMLRTNSTAQKGVWVHRQKQLHGGTRGVRPWKTKHLLVREVWESHVLHPSSGHLEMCLGAVISNSCVGPPIFSWVSAVAVQRNAVARKVFYVCNEIYY